MDLKNTLAAVSLSAAIIVLWGLFFAPDPQEIKEAQLNKEINEQVQNEDAPKLIENEEIKVLSRDNAINQTDRVIFENENIVGSISLTGAVIDDLTFKKYTTSVNGDEKVTLLNPKKLKLAITLIQVGQLIIMKLKLLIIKRFGKWMEIINLPRIHQLN